MINKMKKNMSKVIKIILIPFVVLTTIIIIPKNEISAASSKRSMMFGDKGLNHIRTPLTSNGTSWRGDYLYWGNDATLSWQILSTNSTEYTGLGQPGLLVLSGELGKVVVGENNTYVNSGLDNHISTQCTNKLSSKEYAATLDSSNSTGNYNIGGTGYAAYNEADFTNRKWFAPTGKMMYNQNYGFDSDCTSTDMTRNTNVTYAAWWLSSWSPINSKILGRIYNGYYTSGSTTGYSESRAATNIDTQSLLFISSANGGKSGNDVDASLAPVNATSATKWKVTLDDSANQSIDVILAERKNETDVTITYDKKGAGNYVSAIITDASEENIIYYDRIQKVASGELDTQKTTVKLPADFDKNNYKLKLFTENYTGETSTDYASAIVDVKLSAKGTYTYLNAKGMNIETELYFLAGDSITYLTLPETIGYRFDKWILSPADAIDINKKVRKNFKATASYIELLTYKYVDENGNTIVDSDGKIGSGIVDKGTDISTTVPDGPAKAGYRFKGWKYQPNDVDITNLNKEFIATPEYALNKYDLETENNFFTYDGNDAKKMFGSLSEEEIKNQLIKMYNVELYYAELPETIDSRMINVSINDIDGLKVGKEGKYIITFNYLITRSYDAMVTKEVTLEIKNSNSLPTISTNQPPIQNELVNTSVKNIVVTADDSSFGVHNIVIVVVAVVIGQIIGVKKRKICSK